MRNKLFLKILIPLSVILLIIFSFVIYQFLMAKNASDHLYDMVLEENYAKSEDLAACKTVRSNRECLSSLNSYLQKGISLQVAFIDKQTSPSIVSALSKGGEAASKQDWIKANKYLTDAVSKKEGLLSDYTSRNTRDAKAIHSKLQPNTISNYYINTSWAVVTVVSAGTDPANILLKKGGSSWEVAAGPGTFFDPGTSSTFDAPKMVEEHLQAFHNGTVVIFSSLTDDLGYGLFAEVNTLMSEADSTLPLSNALPLKTDEFEIHTDYVNNKPFYIVTVYYENESNKQPNEKRALSWFSENGTDPKTAPIEIHYSDLNGEY